MPIVLVSDTYKHIEYCVNMLRSTLTSLTCITQYLHWCSCHWLRWCLVTQTPVVHPCTLLADTGEWQSATVPYDVTACCEYRHYLCLAGSDTNWWCIRWRLTLTLTIDWCWHNKGVLIFDGDRATIVYEGESTEIYTRALCSTQA